MGNSNVSTEQEDGLGKLGLVGGKLCLDFVNTMEPRRGGSAHDHLGRYADLVLWAMRAGELNEEEAKHLLDAAGCRPTEAEAVFRRALSLRDTIYRIFFAVVSEEEPRRLDLDELARTYADAARHSRIIHGADGFAWDWSENANLERPLWPLARSAVELLTSGELERLKECPVEEGGCGWLFFDESKNRSRRWCSMADCGSKVKMRRLYARKRGRGSTDE